MNQSPDISSALPTNDNEPILAPLMPSTLSVPPCSYTSTEKGKSLINKRLCNSMLLMLKLIPMLSALGCWGNLMLLYSFHIDEAVTSLFFGISYFPLLFIYIATFVFHFHLYHRLFLYYIALSNGVCIIDFYYGVPLNDYQYEIFHFLLFGIFVLLIISSYVIINKKHGGRFVASPTGHPIGSKCTTIHSCKKLHKPLLIFLKYMPIIIAMGCLLNTSLSFFGGIDAPFLSFLFGLALLPWLFIYIATLVFRFCIYHRMFLYYLLLSISINIIDFQYSIPNAINKIIIEFLIISGFSLFLILFWYEVRHKKAIV